MPDPMATSTNQNGLALAWDGPLIKQIQALGEITGTVNLTYNNDFLVSSIAMNEDAVAYNYDLDGLLVQAGALSFLRDGGVGFVTNSALGLIQDHRGINGFGDFVYYQADFDGEELYGVDFQHDALGRITSRVERIMGETNHFAYGYDVVGRLIRVETNGTLRAVYQYDANGNRTNAVIDSVQAAGDADDQDRLLSYGSATYQYNDHGTLTNKVDGTNTTAYVYDTRGSLLEVRSGTNVITYTVDALGRRIARTHNGETTQRFVYQDFLKPIAELDGDGSVVSRFVYATRVNVPDYIVKGEDVYRVITDHLGSVRLVVHADTGVVAQRMDYDEWGNVLLDTSSGFQPFGYAGGLYDAETGLVRFGYRDYDPQVGRWLAKDPILFAGGQANLYLYVHGDPINFIDPWGLAEDGFWSRYRNNYNEILDDLYGSDLEWADDLGLYGWGAFAVNAGASALQGVANHYAGQQIANSALAGVNNGGSIWARQAAAYDGARVAGRTAAGRAALGTVGRATAVVGAAATGYSVGARLNAGVRAIGRTIWGD